ncbi:MAG: uracil-DNA glycosylase family protein [Planctomycetia bacterium]|nr:uracil-DNA glycosylase family protein [Planctomycetia bacterium]
MIETHPWPPFLPQNATILFLGSFPPPEKRWSMPFFYPNPQNDFWRIVGFLFFHDKTWFLTPDARRFDQPKIEAFLRKEGIALYDVGRRVERLAGNAADHHLKIVEPVDLAELLRQVPDCRTLVATGQKALEEILRQADVSVPPLKIGEFVEATLARRPVRIYRMPSTSRAYPQSLKKKAAFYRTLFTNREAP